MFTPEWEKNPESTQAIKPVAQLLIPDLMDESSSSRICIYMDADGDFTCEHTYDHPEIIDDGEGGEFESEREEIDIDVDDANDVDEAITLANEWYKENIYSGE